VIHLVDRLRLLVVFSCACNGVLCTIACICKRQIVTVEPCSNESALDDSIRQQQNHPGPRSLQFPRVSDTNAAAVSQTDLGWVLDAYRILFRLPCLQGCIMTESKQTFNQVWPIASCGDSAEPVHLPCDSMISRKQSSD